MVASQLADALEDVTVSAAEMTTRDGCRLVADIWRPQGAGPWPVLLMRQPYGRDIASTVVYAQPAWFARHGYLVVIQDVRGRGGSEGVFEAFAHEASDGAEAIAWAASLPGSNGKVGMYGFSYQAMTQLLAATRRPPALLAVAPHMAAFDLYDGWFYREGLLQLHSTVTWANQMLREDAARSGDDAAYAALEASWQAPGRLASRLPVGDISELTHPALPRYAANWLQRDERDAYWESGDVTRRFPYADIPVFHLGGYYDFYARGTFRGYHKAAAHAPENQFLVAGPWVHIPWGRRLGGADLGPQARLDTDQLLVRWFDRWLKDDATAQAETSGVRYFVLGPNQWKTSTAWPPPEAQSQQLYLQSGGNANSCFGDGVLAAEPGGASDIFNYDPEVPVLAPGAVPGGSITWGPADLTPSQQGNNLLVYTGAPAATPWTLVGAATLVLHVRSTAPDTSFVARLSHVDRTGKATFLTLGAKRLRDGAVDAEGVTRLDLPLDDIAVAFAPGERLRVDVASSAYPLLIRHPNTKISPAAVTSPRDFSRALQVVHHSPTYPSHLTFHILHEK